INTSLLSLLIKNNVRSLFYKNAHVPLHKIIQMTNQFFIQKKLTSTNLITGVLLRIANNRIEYVNAGHADILHQSGKTGKIRVVTINDKNIKGNPIGLKECTASYTSIAFTMNPKDIVFVYTKALTESMNKNGERYGTRRVIHSLSECTSESLEKKLKKLEKDLYEFCKTDTFKKDVTMIMIQKK
ncbi:MAG TPA: SpoIIE family protein phosphatase, partial [Treponemataceae bacterium]|nr:SpoIIE family protein phosphatase [Treponemataceae bacterium]